MKKETKLSISQVFVYLVLLFVFVFFSVLTKTFLSTKNLLNICRQVSMTGICAVGMTMVLLTGGIDISIGSIIALSGVVSAKLINDLGFGIFPAMVVGVLVGIVCGLISGIMVAHFEVPALIATLAMQTIARGFAFIMMQGILSFGPPYSVNTLGQGYFLGIPIPVYILALVFFIGWWMLEQTSFGRHLYAIGGNEEVARLSGINVLVKKIQIYSLSGFFAGLSGVIMLSRLNSGQPATSEGFEMDVITAAVLGGVSVAGGQGKIINVVAGVLIMGMLSNGMTLMNLDEYWQWVAKGAVLLFAVAFDNMQRRRKAKT